MKKSGYQILKERCAALEKDNATLEELYDKQARALVALANQADKKEEEFDSKYKELSDELCKVRQELRKEKQRTLEELEMPAIDRHVNNRIGELEDEVERLKSEVEIWKEEVNCQKKDADYAWKCFDNTWNEMHIFMGPIRRWIYDMSDGNAFRKLVYNVCKLFTNKED